LTAAATPTTNVTTASNSVNKNTDISAVKSTGMEVEENHTNNQIGLFWNQHQKIQAGCGNSDTGNFIDKIECRRGDTDPASTKEMMKVEMKYHENPTLEEDGLEIIEPNANLTPAITAVETKKGPAYDNGEIIEVEEGEVEIVEWLPVPGNDNSRYDVRTNCQVEHTTSGFEIAAPSTGPFEMIKIVASPYEENSNAEVGEALFEDFKALLEPIDGTGNDMNPKLECFFGDSFARAVFDARQAIKARNECFVPSWVDGKLGDMEQARWIPCRHLGACLFEDRFVSASLATLSRISRDLETTKSSKDAIAHLGLQEQFPKLAACNKSFMYNEDDCARECFLCEIFVARAYTILYSLGREAATPESLLKKMPACLKIMEANCNVSRDKVVKLQQKWERKRQITTFKQSQKSIKEKDGTCSRDDGSSNDLIPAQGPVTEISVVRRTGAPKRGSPSGRSTTCPELDASDDTRRDARRVSVRNAEERQHDLMLLYNIVDEQHVRLGQSIEFLQDRIREHWALLRMEMRDDIRAELKTEMRQQKESSVSYTRGKKRAHDDL
jgi:hypothetical protein